MLRAWDWEALAHYTDNHYLAVFVLSFYQVKLAWFSGHRHRLTASMSRTIKQNINYLWLIAFSHWLRHLYAFLVQLGHSRPSSEGHFSASALLPPHLAASIWLLHAVCCLSLSASGIPHWWVKWVNRPRVHGLIWWLFEHRFQWFQIFSHAQQIHKLWLI